MGFGTQHVTEAHLIPLGYEQITSLSSATGLTDIPNGARVAIVQAQTQNVRWRDDGTNPQAAIGMILAADSSMVYTGNLSAIKFIEETTSAALNVSYYK